jgi:hypothetical protein
MKKSILAFALCGSFAFAAGPKTYQVTGPVLAIKDGVITVEKGKEKWEIAQEAATVKGGELKVGAKVTIEYTMSAKTIEIKGGKPAADTAKKVEKKAAKKK